MYNRDKKIKKQRDRETILFKSYDKAKALAGRGCKSEAIAILNALIAGSPNTVAAVKAIEFLKGLDS